MTSRLRNRVSRYCLRCQAELIPRASGNADDSEDPRCPDCRLQYDPGNPDTYLIDPVFRFWIYYLPGFVLAVVFGVVSYTLIVKIREPGLAAFFGVPVCVGAILGYTVRAKLSVQILLVLAGVACVGTGLVTMEVAGLFCGLVGAVVLLIPTLLGLIVGILLRRHLKASQWDQRRFLPLLTIMALPFVVLGVEQVLPRRVDVASVSTEALFEAPPPVAWDAIMFYEEVAHKPPLILRLALPVPIRSEGTKTSVGDVVRCVYDRGYLVKRITAAEEYRRLSFEVLEQNLHFERDVTLLGGSFELSPSGADNPTTRVVLRTHYQRHLNPKWLWEPIERVVIRSLHQHVLKGMREKANKAWSDLASLGRLDGEEPPMRQR